jgi:hypothetical protein
MLYLLKQTEFNRFKIGISKHPEKRVAQLEKTWGSFDDVKIFTVPKDYKKEQALHNVFEAYQIHNLDGDGHTEFFSTDCYDQVHTILTTAPPQYIQAYKVPFFQGFTKWLWKWTKISVVLIILMIIASIAL